MPPVLPTLPETFTVPYSLPVGGTTWPVHSGDNLQAKIDAAALGDVLVLDAGATFEGNFKLPLKTGTADLYIISSALASLPAEGHRVSPADAVNMPCILSTTTLNRSALYTWKSAHNYRFVGIEFKVASGVGITQMFNVIQTGYGTPNYTDPTSSYVAVTNDADLPSHITFDRCYIHSDNAYPKSCRCGFMCNGHYMAAVDCCFKNFIDTSDAQAINIFNGGSHYKFVNNYLEASGENFMLGGTDPAIVNAVSTDIEFRGNYLYKDQATWGTHWAVKNLFELKFGIRVLCTQNVMENCYRDDQGQGATAIVMTVRNQSGTQPAAQIRDVTISYNRIHRAGKAWRLTGYDNFNPSLQTQRILIENNAFDKLTYAASTQANAGQISSVSPGPALDVTIRHNLWMADGDIVQMLFLDAPTGIYAVSSFLMENNIACHGDYGLYGNGVGTGNAALTRYVEGYSTASPTFRKMFMINRPGDRDYSSWQVYSVSGNSPYGGPTSGNKMIDDVGSVGFSDISSINTLAADYRLLPTSPYYQAGNDGLDPGPDWTELNALIARAISGNPQAGTGSFMRKAKMGKRLIGMVAA